MPAICCNGTVLFAVVSPATLSFQEEDESVTGFSIAAPCDWNRLSISLDVRELHRHHVFQKSAKTSRTIFIHLTSDRICGVRR